MMEGQTMPKADDQAQVADAGSAQASEGRSPPASFTLADTTGSPPPNAAASLPDNSIATTGPFCQPRNHRLILTQKALLDIYGPSGPDLGETEDMCHQKVDDWLDNKGMEGVSKATLRRAKRALRTLLRPERS
jgi:hypothetical protein